MSGGAIEREGQQQGHAGDAARQEAEPSPTSAADLSLAAGSAATATAPAMPPAQVLALQRTAGNASVARIVGGRPAKQERREQQQGPARPIVVQRDLPGSRRDHLGTVGGQGDGTVEVRTGGRYAGVDGAVDALHLEERTLVTIREARVRNQPAAEVARFLATRGDRPPAGHPAWGAAEVYLVNRYFPATTDVTNAIEITYDNPQRPQEARRAHWLQFVWEEWIATSPGQAPQPLAGVVRTNLGRDIQLTAPPSGPQWMVDVAVRPNAPIPPPWYDAASGFVPQEHSLWIVDRPSSGSLHREAARLRWQRRPPNIHAWTITRTSRFETYLMVRQGNEFVPRYVVRWTATASEPAGRESVDIEPRYSGISGERVRSIRDELRRAYASDPLANRWPIVRALQAPSRRRPGRTRATPVR